jgi:hypothetical protein
VLAVKNKYGILHYSTTKSLIRKQQKLEAVQVRSTLVCMEEKVFFKIEICYSKISELSGLSSVL